MWGGARLRHHGGGVTEVHESETKSPRPGVRSYCRAQCRAEKPRVRDRGSETVGPKTKAYAVVCPYFSGGRRNDGKPIRTPVIPMKPNESRCSGHKCGMARLVPVHCSAVVWPGLRRIGTHDGADQYVPVVCRVAGGGSML